MNREQAKKLIRDTFEDSFNRGKFIFFIKNLLKTIDGSDFVYQGNYIPDAFKPYIGKLERIGKYSDGQNEIDILIVYLKKEASLEKARTTQRNFIAWYLKGSRGGNYKNASLVAFVSPTEENWRFSLVKVDYVFDDTGRVIEERSPARRWSFLVGKNEKSHTAQSRFLPILENDAYKPTLKDLEEAFNIEPVTKEFFEKYRDLLIKTVDALDKVVKGNQLVKKHFETKGINTVDFAKKLLEQIVFLYFLQKKGWFGVARDASWGTGPRDFLRRLFNKEYGEYKNFFNDILEPLFYEALARERDGNFYSRFNCKIPFLNGGLFEPIGGYDWVHIDLLLPNELFSNNHKTPEGDIGDGILDVFDRFNFTVKEDEPLEKEVAVDPELLGKLYEKFNAIRHDNFYEYKKALASDKKNLEKQFNKKYGVYYTPREIVHYMCQQSLIYYLSNELEGKVSHKEIEELIMYGEEFTENEVAVFEKGKETKTYKYKLSENIRANAKLIDEKLRNIKVCDPAVGSGAFLVGMMHEIVKTRNILSAFINEKGRNIYNFKRECIENSLYGVDIDPGACEVAKLRLWLSLIVDEEDINQIKPLPNLDYKIMQGNSLISSFAGIDFEKIEGAGNIRERLLYTRRYDELIKQFEEVKNQYQNEPSKNKKDQLRKKIDDLILKIFEEKLNESFPALTAIEEKAGKFPDPKHRQAYIIKEKQKLAKKLGFDIEKAREELIAYTEGRKPKNFFLWEIYFAEVFSGDNPGFDVVIANPPYVSTKGTDEKYKEQLEEHFGFADDLYNHFYFKSMEILKENGILTFISSKTFWTIQTKKNLRDLILKNQLLCLYDTGNPFEEQLVDTSVIIVRKKEIKGNYQFIYLDGTKDLSNPVRSVGYIHYYKSAPNQVFFPINDYNLKILEKYGKVVNELLNQWWDKISTSKNIEKYKRELERYRQSLKPGDITLLGLITEGGQGLATGNNGKYIGVLQGTKWAEKVRKERPEKLLLAKEFCKRKGIKSKDEAQSFLDKLTEKEIRKLFDDLKEKYGRDIFGQGWLYRIVSPNEIADVEKLTEDEKLNGIKGTRTFVPYDKGDKEGNRWYAPTPYYIDWSRENVKVLQTDPKARWQGYQFYFREGFCWTNVLNPQAILIKARIKEKSINDVGSMSLSSMINIPNAYFVAILNSYFIFYYYRNFINYSVNIQINDIRQLPVIIPDTKQLKLFENIFNRAVEVQKQKFAGKISEAEAGKKLDMIQKELDEIVEEMYLKKV